MTEQNSVLVAMSGGLDSAVLTSNYLDRKYQVMAVNFQYGSKHNIWEAKAFFELCKEFDIPHHTITLDLSKIVKSNLMKNQGNIPLGHYNSDNMKLTVVPGRNLLFISLMLGIAQSEGISNIALSVHQGDHHIYPDCRKSFIEYADKAVREASEDLVHLQAPFLERTKADIVREGLKLKTPFELTRTCYQDQELSCGQCGACSERLEAFYLNGAKDPIKYAGEII